MLDSTLLIIIEKMRGCSALLISMLSYVFCVITILFISKNFKLIGLCCYIVLCGIMANIQVLYATEYELFHLKVFLGTTVFSSTFLACDIIHKRYGQQNAIDAVYLNLCLNLFFLISMVFALGHKPSNGSEFATNNAAIQTIFSPTPRIILSSYLAAFSSQYSEIFLKKKFGDGLLQHNLSLFISSILIDNFVFITLAMYILAETPLPFSDILQTTTSAVIIRLICNFFNTLVFRFYKFN